MRNRRGSVYILILAASMLVAIIGISALTAARIQHRAAAGTDDLAEARIHARSALEIAVHNISQDPNWRTTYGNTNWPRNRAIGNGVYSIEAVDPDDGDITTGALDPVELTGVGTMGLATQKIRVRLEADPPPLAALNTALHAESQVQVVNEPVNGALIEVTSNGGPNDLYALRAKGSTEDIFGEATMHPWAIVPVDANQLLQGKVPGGSMMYWADFVAFRIQRANLDGTGVENLINTGLADSRGIAMDVAAGKMYLTLRGGKKIQRANSDGTAIEDLITTGLSRPRGIALDITAGKMYWIDSSALKIQRANIDGTAVEDLITLSGTDARDIALDVAAGKMYWTLSGSDNQIYRANLDGSVVENLITGLTGPSGIALDVSQGKMYWADDDKVKRANLDGTVIEDVVTGLSDARGIAVDVTGGKMYWTDDGLDKIQRANLDGTGVEDLVTTGLSGPGQIALGAGGAPDNGVDFFLIGHTLGGDEQSFTYIDPSVDVTPVTSAAWASVDVSAYLPAGATGVIVHAVGASTGSRPFGLRKAGSIDNRTDVIYEQDHLWAMIGVDANRVFEAYIGQTDMTLRLAGYTGAGVTFFTNAKDKSLTTMSTWTDIDISADTGADAAIGAIIEIDGAFKEAYGVRMKGSIDNRIREARHGWAVIGVDDTEAFEGIITSTDMDFYLVGYITEGAVFKTNADNISLTTAGSYVDIDISTLTRATATFTAVGAPVSCDVQIVNDGVIYGDAEAVMVISNNGTITGTQTVFVPSKVMPASTVFDMYVDLATDIPNPGSIDRKVLSPGNNPWGATDPDGVYYIDTLGGDLTIRASRIHGTLLVRCGTGTVRIETTALLHPYRADYPTLIVDGNLEVLLDSADRTLSEARWGVNFNPTGTNFRAVSNGDMNDEFPNEIQGLVHVTGNLLMGRSSRVWGAIICENSAACQQDTAVIHDPDLYANPPLGYTDSVATPPMTIVSGSWEQVVD